MKAFQKEFTDVNRFRKKERDCDFNNFLKVLNCEKPDRPTLFEFYIDDVICSQIADQKIEADMDFIEQEKIRLQAFERLGYDYITMHGCDLSFETQREEQGEYKSISLNSGAVISDEESFEAYQWPDPDACDYSRLVELEKELPNGMKIIVFGPGGILENVITLVGYENLCYLLVDEPELVEKIFERVGSIFVRYYEICSQYDSVGALMLNDDWGFNTQTMLSHEDMRKYVLPWHKKAVEVIKKNKKPVILHSCGKLKPLMEDIIYELGFNAKHSNEDNIYPIEEFYEDYKGKIGILGGIDLHFLCTKTPEEVYNRAAAMLERAEETGGYALGSGNSIADYVPLENYLAMIAAAR